MPQGGVRGAQAGGCGGNDKKKPPPYLYLPRSEVFHTRECRMLRASWNIQGFCTYADAQRAGKRPCKICNPESEAVLAIRERLADIPADIREAICTRRKEDKKTSLSPETLKALKRLNEARSERKQAEAAQTPGEALAIKSLSHTEYAFWAGKGYQNFHVRECPRLKGLTELRGFSSYKKAVKAGFKPCKTCKPTRKLNVNVSFPLYSAVYKDERLEEIEETCKRYGYSFRATEEELIIKTPVGEWTVQHKAYPLKLHHRNFVLDYKKRRHIQPKEFVSLTDVIRYINQHDCLLMKKARNGCKYGEEML